MSIMDGFMKQEVSICKRQERSFNGKIIYGPPVITKAKVKEAVKIKKTSEGEEIYVDLEIAVPADVDVNVQDKVIYNGEECTVIIKSDKYGLDGKVIYKKIFTNRKVS